MDNRDFQLQEMQKRIAELEAQQKETNMRMERVEQKMQTVFEHIGELYKAQTIEQTVEILGELSAKSLDAQKSAFYCVDTADDKKIFTSENGKRTYADRQKNELLSDAIEKGEPVISERNVAIPIRAENEVMGVVVAENCKFTDDVIKKFSSDGEIGSVFKLGLEKERNHQIGITDKLTRLHNREGMSEYSQITMIETLQNKQPVSLVMCDIDHFKSVNDTYGHDVGDKVLQHIAKILKENIRSRDNDQAFRFGGEEFILAFNNVDKADTYALADRIRNAIEHTPCDIGNGKFINITISMGVDQLQPDKIPHKDEIMSVIEKSLKNADNRLYDAKETGRNKVVADLSENEMLMAKQKYEVLDLLKQIDYSAVDYKDCVVVTNNETKEEKTFVGFEDIANQISSYAKNNVSDEKFFATAIENASHKSGEQNVYSADVLSQVSKISESVNKSQDIAENDVSYKKIIGNTSYNALGVKADLQYFSNLNNRHAENIARELDKQGIKYSGVVLDDKTTLTVNKADAPKVYKAEEKVKATYSKSKSLDNISKLQDNAEKQIQKETKNKDDVSR